MTAGRFNHRYLHAIKLILVKVEDSQCSSGSREIPPFSLFLLLYEVIGCMKTDFAWRKTIRIHALTTGKKL